MERNKIIGLMAARNLFEGASAEVLGGLVDLGTVVSIQHNDLMIEQGKIGEAIWVLLEGTVLIVVNAEESHELNTPGTILGEISAVSYTAATATVKAATDLKALRISHQDFHKALSNSETLASSVLRSLSKYLN